MDHHKLVIGKKRIAAAAVNVNAGKFRHGLVNSGSSDRQAGIDHEAPAVFFDRHGDFAVSVPGQRRRFRVIDIEPVPFRLAVIQFHAFRQILQDRRIFFDTSSFQGRRTVIFYFHAEQLFHILQIGAMLVQQSRRREEKADSALFFQAFMNTLPHLFITIKLGRKNTELIWRHGV